MLALLACSLFIVTSAAIAQNFACDDAEIVARAEQARCYSAIYWSGAELPGRWSVPCPIVVTLADHSGGGATTFTFAGGEVYGWRMQVSGRREAICNDVIPHEVDHMVRASLVRRPIPRWLDEGCASDRESETSQQRMRAEARRLIDSGTFTTIDNAWLDAMDYPGNSAEVAALYAVGHSLVEFLIERGGPGRLLDFQRDPRLPSEKLEAFYNLRPAEFFAVWREWILANESSADAVSTATLHAVECPLLSPHRPCDYAGPNLLTVYTSHTCGPCRQFWFDLQNDAEFRDAICARFHLHRVDVDLQPIVARQAGIDTVPTFVTRQGRVVGYHGKAWLIERLNALMPVVSEGAAINTDNASPTNENPVVDEVDGTLSATVSESDPERDTIPESTASIPATTQSSIDALPIAFTLLEWLGIVGGSAATGGVGTLALWGVLRFLQRRRQRRESRVTNHDHESVANAMATPTDAGASESTQEVTLRAPFPRKLDEACELLALGRSEGRVAVLDTLRGMFLDDELDKFASAGKDQNAWSKQLKDAIDARVEEVAPLSVEIA